MVILTVCIIIVFKFCTSFSPKTKSMFYYYCETLCVENADFF